MKITTNLDGYQTNGLRINWENDNTLRLNYNGVLANCGAQEVYLHTGDHNWNNTTYLKMNRTNNGFETEIPVNCNNTQCLNVCFKDNANNWDNNSGNNYCIEINK